jgi:hypothetical protein
MGDAVGDIVTVILGILFYATSIISIIAIAYSYLKTWMLTRDFIIMLEMRAVHPVLIILIRVVNYAKYLAIPVIVWGLIWYTNFAIETVG